MGTIGLIACKSKRSTARCECRAVVVGVNRLGNGSTERKERGKKQSSKNVCKRNKSKKVKQKTTSEQQPQHLFTRGKQQVATCYWIANNGRKLRKMYSMERRIPIVKWIAVHARLQANLPTFITRAPAHVRFIKWNLISKTNVKFEDNGEIIMQKRKQKSRCTLFFTPHTHI